MKKIIYAFIAVWMGMTACTPSVEYPTMVNRKPSIYPDYIGVTIPADIAPMNFNIKGDTVDVVDVVAKEARAGNCMSVVNGLTSMWKTGISLLSRTSVEASLLPSVPVRMASGSNIRISR